ncbi:MAG: glucose-1-phosphate adenylyltransferase subunit GlgD [Bacilli bacterium]|nr:glucose-1-phosphate adenylyltransferase subunit GlgD [Bacilli bacterium]
MATLGLIFSNIRDKEIFEVTRERTIASTPIGGRYRLIDFALSNMVNNGISHIGVVTKNNYQSLMDHVGSGKDWDLARKRGGLVILPPYGISQNVYNSRLEALKSIKQFISKANEEYVVLTDCYYVCNLDYKPIFKQHFATNADITCVYRKKNVTADDYMPINVFEVDSDNTITAMNIHQEFIGEANVSADTWIMKRELLVHLVEQAIEHNWKSFNRDILRENLHRLKIGGYRFNGYFGSLSSMDSYYQINMDLKEEAIRNEIFYQKGRSIYTKVRDSAPTKYGFHAKVVNSIIADGCTIDGYVENSVLFRGTHVAQGATVKNSILMQSTQVKENAVLDYVVTDKNVKIVEVNELVGQKDKVIYIRKDGVV